MGGAGRVVLLNGPSSSGKTSIGRAMLPLLDDPWFFVPVDAVSGLRSESYRRALDDAGVAEMLQRTRRGYHRAIAGLASVGNDVIMDYPLSEPWRLVDLLEVLEPFEVLLVDVMCAPDELVRRELARGDRPVGLAASQAVFAHASAPIGAAVHGTFDGGLQMQDAVRQASLVPLGDRWTGGRFATRAELKTARRAMRERRDRRLAGSGSSN